MINGKGWKCSKKTKNHTWTDWLKNNHQDFEEISRKDCMEMIRSKRCNGRKMYCDNKWLLCNKCTNGINTSFVSVSELYSHSHISIRFKCSKYV